MRKAPMFTALQSTRGRASHRWPAQARCVGISRFNELPVVIFALRPEFQNVLTPYYALALARNFGPHLNYRGDITSLSQPMEGLVADGDEQFYPERFSSEFSAARRKVPVSIVPGVGSHICLTVDSTAIQATESAIGRLSVYDVYPPPMRDRL